MKFMAGQQQIIDQDFSKIDLNFSSGLHSVAMIKNTTGAADLWIHELQCRY
jgi:hypothetical protein